MPSRSTAQKPLALATSETGRVFETVCTLLAPYNHNGLALRSETNIISEMEIDSVSIFDLVMEVEDTYEVAFPMETISEMKTIGDLVMTINAMKNS